MHEIVRLNPEKKMRALSQNDRIDTFYGKLSHNLQAKDCVSHTRGVVQNYRSIQ